MGRLDWKKGYDNRYLYLGTAAQLRQQTSRADVDWLRAGVRSRKSRGRTSVIRVLLTVPQLKSTASPYREVMAIAKYLPRSDFHLTVCSLRDGGFREAEPKLHAGAAAVFVARFRPRGRSLRHVLASVRDQSVIARHGPFDIQHSMDFTYSPLEALFGRLAGRAHVFSQRNIVPGHRWLLRCKIALAHRIVAISGPVTRFLLQQGAPAGKIQTIPLGIDPAEREGKVARPRDDRSESLLSVGQIVRRKRHEDAIRTLARLATGRPGLRLRIAGHAVDPAYERELRRLAGELGVADRVDFLGAREDVLDLMRQADCLLLCSEREAFGWVILEAMASGLPVVASSVDGPGEVIEHGTTGFLVPVGDIERYAEAVREILERPQVSHSFAVSGRRLVSEKYSAKAMVDRLAALYREMAASRRAVSREARTEDITRFQR